DVHATINTYYIGNIDDASVKLSYVSLYNLNEWSVSNIYTYDAVALKFDDLPSTSIEYVCLGFGSQLEYSIAGDANYKYNYLTTDNRFINTVTVGEYEFYTVEQLLNYNSCYQLAKSYGTYFKDSYSSIDYSLVKLAGINAFSDGVYDFTELDTISYSTFFETGTGEDIINQAYDIGTSDNNLIDLPSNITVGGFSYDVYWFVVDVDSDTSDVLYNAESNYYFNTIFIARLDDGSGDEDEQPIFVYPDTTYNIIYEVNGGIMNDVEYPTTYKTGDKVVLPMGVSKEGYIFVGWYLDSRLTKKMIQSISTLAQGTITVYAKYISKDSLSDGEFYVNIEVPGHSEDIITGNYKTGDVIDLPTFTQEGYTLIGYRDNPYNEGELVSKVTVGTSNLFHTYYPVWAKEVTK
ncbi:MAG: InlB B-repeat-containing protein, partial [Bacilli bacterium]